MGTAGLKSHSDLVCCRVGSTGSRRRQNSKGSAASKLIPPFASPLCDPPKLLAVVPGVTAQIWAGFGPCVEVSACPGVFCVLPWLLASPQGRAAEFLLQQELLPGCELSLPVAGGEQMGCQNIQVPVWTPTYSCHHVTDSLAKAFSLPAPKTLWLLSLQKRHTLRSVSPGSHQSSLLCLGVASQGWKIWDGRRERG